MHLPTTARLPLTTDFTLWAALHRQIAVAPWHFASEPSGLLLLLLLPQARPRTVACDVACVGSMAVPTRDFPLAVPTRDFGGPAVRALPDFLEAQAPVFSLPTMSAICRHCGSLNFPSERAGPGNVFSICCRKGKTSHLDGNVAVPPELQALFTESGERARHFRAAIRLYNSAMSFLSFGLECFNSVPGVGPPVVVSHGTVYHVAGQLTWRRSSARDSSMLWMPIFCVCSPASCSVALLMSACAGRCGRLSTSSLPRVAFRLALQLLPPWAASRRYARPTQSEVAVVFGGRDGVPATNRDIVVWPHQHPQHRVNECN